MKIKCILFLFLVINTLQEQEQYKEIDLIEGKPVNFNPNDINKGDIYFFTKASKDQHVILKFTISGTTISLAFEYYELTKRSLDSKIILDDKNYAMQRLYKNQSNFVISYDYKVLSPKANYVCFKLKKSTVNIWNIIAEYYIQEDASSNNKISTSISNTKEMTFKANNKYSYYVETEGGKNATNANESSSSGVTIFIVLLILIIIGVAAFFAIKNYRTPKINEITSPLTPVEI
jgi:hypothetical protein